MRKRSPSETIGEADGEAGKRPIELIREDAGDRDSAFVDRLEELATQFRSRAALAKAAGLSPGSLQHYLDGSDPTRRVLIALARAARVSVAWLASGEGPKGADAVPAGHVNLPVFDLGRTGDHTRGIVGHLDDPPAKGRLFNQSELIEALPSLRSYVVEHSPLEFTPLIRAGDVFVFSKPHRYSIAEPSRVETWDFVSVGDQDIYLVGENSKLKLRKLRRTKKDSVQVLDAQGAVESALTGTPVDFMVFGRVIWRGGIVKPSQPAGP